MLIRVLLLLLLCSAPGRKPAAGAEKYTGVSRSAAPPRIAFRILITRRRTALRASSTSFR